MAVRKVRRAVLLNSTLVKEDDQFFYYHGEDIGPYKIGKPKGAKSRNEGRKTAYADGSKETKTPYLQRVGAEYTEKALMGTYRAVKARESRGKHPLRNAGLIAAGLAGLFVAGYFVSDSDRALASKSRQAYSRPVDREKSIAHIREELIEGMRTRDQRRLNALRSERKEYVNEAMKLLLADSSMTGYGKLFGEDVTVHLSLTDYALLKVAEGVADRYDILKRAQADRAEKERIAKLREEFRGYPAEQLTPEQRARYKELLNVRDENEVDPAVAEARENERKRQEILGGARGAAGQAARAADDFRYNIQNNQRRLENDLRQGAKNAVDGQLDAAGKAVEQGKQDLGKAWDDLTKQQKKN